MNTMITLVLEATRQTIVMVFLSTIFSMILGFPIGVLLHVTGSEEHGGIIPHPVFCNIIGTMATVIPLSIAAAPFVARVI